MGRRGILRRAGRRTNAALLLLTAGAFLTGALAFGAGTPVPAVLATVAHGLLGLGVVALVPWKSVIIRRATSVPLAALALTGLILVCLLAGFGQFFAGFEIVAGLSPIQVHVGSALVAVPLLAWHVLRSRPQPLRPADLSRRSLLSTAAFAAAVAVVYPGIARVAHWTRGRDGRIATGSSRVDTGEIPATIWLLDRVPALDPTTHRVDVVGRPLSVPDLERLSVPVRARLDCTSGWYAEATWSATPLSVVVPADSLARAVSITVTSVTGYTRRFPVGEASSLWLATRCEGRLLSTGTGSPVRLVVPHRRGFWWVKWVASVELSDVPAWRQLPFPAQ